jgi:hypothetical protein
MVNRDGAMALTAVINLRVAAVLELLNAETIVIGSCSVNRGIDYLLVSSDQSTREME